MALESEQKRRRYVFSQKELKKKLGIEGTIVRMDLWQGRSTNDVNAGVSTDEETWYIETEDGDFEPTGG